MFRDDDAHGWSEAHQIDGGGVPNLVELRDNFDQLMRTKRVPLLASDGFYIGCRVAYKTTSGRNPSLNKLADLAISGSSPGSGIKWQMAAAEIACKSRLQNAGNTANNDTYIRGIPQIISNAGQLDFSGAGGGAFKSSLDAYMNALIQGQYGWFGVDSQNFNNGQMTNYTLNEDSTVTFTLLPKAGSTALLPNLTYSVRFSRINNSKSILNRTFVCRAITPTSITTLKQVAATEFLTPGTYSVKMNTFEKYTIIAYYKLAQRKTGKVFGVGRGRRSVEVLH
jgi:hypothetical protein